MLRDRKALGAVLGAVAYGFSQVAAAATGPADGMGLGPLPPLTAQMPAPLDKSAGSATTGNPLWAIPLNSLSSTRERPLFSPSRRPPPPVVVAAPAAPPPAPSKPAEPDHPLLTLVGTAVGEAVRVGIFTEESTKDVIRLRIGEGHGGWTLRALEGREATFEKDRREVTLALPARNGTVQEAASVSQSNPTTAFIPQSNPTVVPAAMSNPMTPPVAASKPAMVPAAAPVPKRPVRSQTGADAGSNAPQTIASTTANENPATAPAAAWLDGDGQAISPPPAQKTTEDGKPSGPAEWLDGYGRPIGPAPSTWNDGDGQSSVPPPYRWLDADGNAVVPPPPVWVDGDGQLISPPLPRTSQSRTQ